MMKRSFFLFFSISMITAALFAQNTAQRAKYNFNGNWKVFTGDAGGGEAAAFDDASWKAVTLPYAWNEDDAFKKDIADHTTGIAWYRKHFTLPAAAKGQKVFVEFEGIRQAGEFYLNGIKIGMHENGVMAFGFDVTDQVKWGNAENVIAARIDNDWNYREKATNTKYQWEDKNFNANYGGITKNVYLHIAPKIYQTLPLYANLKTTGIYIYADQYNIRGRSATVHAESEVKNETALPQQVSYEVSLTDLNGKLVKTFVSGETAIAPGETKTVTASSPVAGLNFWSWGVRLPVRCSDYPQGGRQAC